jgi:hypothetical protein
MSVIIFIGQMLLGVPFVIFAYRYQREEAWFAGASPQPTHQDALVCHGLFGIFVQRQLRNFRDAVPPLYNGNSSFGSLHIYTFPRTRQY